MTLTFHINLDSIFYLPDWVVHPTLVDPFLFQTAGAEQAGRAKGWSPAQALWAGFFKQRDFFERSEIEIRCPRCEAPLPTNHNNDNKYPKNIENNDFYNDKPPKSDNDNLTDGTEDTNHNGRIDGDNGDGKLSDSEYWRETSPNIADTDSDEITDYWEIQYGYSPVKADTDGDSLLDSEEDLDKDGVLDPTESNPLKTDSDDDGLDDNIELDGWTVVIIYESTKEIKTRYSVTSNPLVKDSEGDGLTDLQEYSNITDPWLSDSDGDGKTDLQELTGDYNSSATGIDGEPPEIWHFDFYYEENYQDFFFLKIPTGGLKVIAEIGAKDIFGIDTIYADITGLKDKKIHCGGQENVTYTLEWSINSVDKYERVLFKGFSINVSIIDVNGNVGFKEDDLPSVKEMAIAFFFGPLLAIVEMISELVSGFLSWINKAVNSVITPALDKIEELFGYFIESLFEILAPLIIKLYSSMDIIEEEVEKFTDFFLSGPVIITMCFIGIAISVALLLCCGIDSLVAIAIQLVVVAIMMIISAVAGDDMDISSPGIVIDPLQQLLDDNNYEDSKNVGHLILSPKTSMEYALYMLFFEGGMENDDFIRFCLGHVGFTLTLLSLTFGIITFGSYQSLTPLNRAQRFGRLGAIVSAIVSIVLAIIGLLIMALSDWVVDIFFSNFFPDFDIALYGGFFSIISLVVSAIGFAVGLIGFFTSLWGFRKPDALSIIALLSSMASVGVSLAYFNSKYTEIKDLGG